MTTETLKTLLPLLLPIIALQIGLMVYSLVDLFKRETVRFNNKAIWAVVIIFVNMIGPIVYLAIGRSDK